jgi:mono/diheme cytochrome c family protein
MRQAIGRGSRSLVGIALAGAATASLAQQVPAPSRGALLYDTHCVACHDSQVHWRDKKVVTDWDSLKTEVRHWQARARLAWSEADIVEVARHLNEVIYRFPQTTQRLTRHVPAEPG